MLTLGILSLSSIGVNNNYINANNFVVLQSTLTIIS